MDTRRNLINAALQVLDEGGEAAFSTRAVLSIAKLSAPTLYHHFGNADGMLSAAVTEAFAQLLHAKTAAASVQDPVTALRNGWDDYVAFAATRPRIYAAMLSRVLQGGEIEAAGQAWAHLLAQLDAVAKAGRLALPVAEAAELMWASSSAAALLHVTARLRRSPPPGGQILVRLRDDALGSILT